MWHHWHQCKRCWMERSCFPWQTRGVFEACLDFASNHLHWWICFGFSMDCMSTFPLVCFSHRERNGERALLSDISLASQHEGKKVGVLRGSPCLGDLRYSMKMVYSRHPGQSFMLFIQHKVHQKSQFYLSFAIEPHFVRKRCGGRESVAADAINS